jgi:glucose dehydrogenase
LILPDRLTLTLTLTQAWMLDVASGGTVWISMAFDPELNLLYFCIGNGTLWSREQFSPGDSSEPLAAIGEGECLIKMQRS